MRDAFKKKKNQNFECFGNIAKFANWTDPD